MEIIEEPFNQILIILSILFIIPVTSYILGTWSFIDTLALLLGVSIFLLISGVLIYQEIRPPKVQTYTLDYNILHESWKYSRYVDFTELNKNELNKK
jgi:hypothetical protein